MFSVNSRTVISFNQFNVYDVSQVSLRVERRLLDIEDEMRSGRQVLSERQHREKTKHVSGELQEVKYQSNVDCMLLFNK